MKLYCKSDSYKLYNGSMLDLEDVIAPNSIDSIVTDPPYELNFMGKSWDNSGIAFQKETWRKCYDVLKPGGYILAFGGSRTYHRIACAIEDAGFEIRDCIMWIYGSGFPKSMSVGKAMEAKLMTGSSNKTQFKNLVGEKAEAGNWGISKFSKNQGFGKTDYSADGHLRTISVEYQTEAKEWDGWGTSLKPAYEPIIVARKPLDGTVADNVQKWGVGAINIDECRIGSDVIKGGTMPKMGGGELGVCNYGTIGADRIPIEDHIGRFPANIIHDGSDEATAGMPYTNGNGNVRHNHNTMADRNCYNDYQDCDSYGYEDEGGAARYFYCAKASKRDRDEGLDCYEAVQATDGYARANDHSGHAYGANPVAKRNFHPTVKPTSLMQYLVRLVTPKGGTVLDPFNGSGSTGKAVMYENHDRNARYKYIGIELQEEYCQISKARIDYAALDKSELQSDFEEPQQTRKEGQISIFDME